MELFSQVCSRPDKENSRKLKRNWANVDSKVDTKNPGTPRTPCSVKEKFGLAALETNVDDLSGHDVSHESSASKTRVFDQTDDVCDVWGHGIKVVSSKKENLKNIKKQYQMAFMRRSELSSGMAEKLYTESEDPTIKLLSGAIIGITETLNLIKNSVKRNKTVSSRVTPKSMVKSSAATFRKYRLIVKTVDLEISDVDVAKIFAEVPSKYGTLDSIVKSYGRAYLSGIMKNETRGLFSLSASPQEHFHTLPAFMYDSAVEILSHAVKPILSEDAIWLEEDKMSFADLVSITFSTQLSQLCSRARRINKAKSFVPTLTEITFDRPVLQELSASRESSRRRPFSTSHDSDDSDQ